MATPSDMSSSFYVGSRHIRRKITRQWARFRSGAAILVAVLFVTYSAAVAAGIIASGDPAGALPANAPGNSLLRTAAYVLDGPVRPGAAPIASITHWRLGTHAVDARTEGQDAYATAFQVGCAFVTAAHVAHAGVRGLTVLVGREWLPATITRLDVREDLAILKLRAMDCSMLTSFRISSGRPRFRSTAWAVCAVDDPFLITLSVIQPNASEYLPGKVGGIPLQSERINDAILLIGPGGHQGCSGGPILNLAGDVIGIVLGGDSSGIIATAASHIASLIE